MLSNLGFTLDRDQEDSRLNVGIDMGKNKRAMDILDTSSGKHRHHTFTGSSYLLDA